ncbi:hypothetical protein D3C83_95110 [compost metagenome]
MLCPAKCRLWRSCASVSTETPYSPALSRKPCIRERLPIDTKTIGGSRDPDMNAFAVIACRTPSTRALTTTMPVAKRPSAVRNVRPSMVS